MEIGLQPLQSALSRRSRWRHSSRCPRGATPSSAHANGPSKASSVEPEARTCSATSCARDRGGDLPRPARVGGVSERGAPMTAMGTRPRTPGGDQRRRPGHRTAPARPDNQEILEVVAGADALEWDQGNRVSPGWRPSFSGLDFRERCLRLDRAGVVARHAGGAGAPTPPLREPSAAPEVFQDSRLWGGGGSRRRLLSGGGGRRRRLLPSLRPAWCRRPSARCAGPEDGRRLGEDHGSAEQGRRDMVDLHSDLAEHLAGLEAHAVERDQPAGPGVGAPCRRERGCRRRWPGSFRLRGAPPRAAGACARARSAAIWPPPRRSERSSRR